VSQNPKDTRNQEFYLQPGDTFKIKGVAGVQLCVDAKWEGGGTAQACDVYPDGWSVYYCRLTDGATYNPDAKVNHRYQSGCFTSSVMMPPFELLPAKMEKTVVVRWKKRAPQKKKARTGKKA
jgi:hypothetical protein